MFLWQLELLAMNLPGATPLNKRKNMSNHESYMARAIKLAEKGRGEVSPNPMVGCVLVKDGEVIGEGYHQKFGESHAEVMAFRNAIRDPIDCTVYVNLEPCNIDSKTPPCTKFLKENTEFDVYIPLEGEVGFSNILEKVLNFNSRENLKKQISEETIDGCILRKPNNDFQYSPTPIRTKNHDDIPSPYLNGMMDKFFDGKLSPALQTYRGCPFLCTYCVDGNTAVNEVNKFSLDRVCSEL